MGRKRKVDPGDDGHAQEQEQEQEPYEPLPCTPLSQFTARDIEPLWPGYLYYGGMSILDGDPGVGKTALFIDIAARLTTGRALPGQPSAHRRKRGWRGVPVLFVCENPPDQIILPRCEAAGADPSLVHVFGRSPRDRYRAAPQFPDALPDLEHWIRKTGARFVVIDPITSHLKGVNTGDDGEVREIMEPLVCLMNDLDVCLWLTRHNVKDKGRRSIAKGLGSIAFNALSWTVLGAMEHPDIQGRQVFGMVKTNVGPWPTALQYACVPAGKQMKVEWHGPAAASAAEALEAQDLLGRRKGLQECKAFLRAEVKDWIKANTVLLRAKSAGLGGRTLDTAKAVLGVQTRRKSSGKESWWEWGPPADGWPKT